jgi:hypothetical protein
VSLTHKQTCCPTLICRSALIPASQHRPSSWLEFFLLARPLSVFLATESPSWVYLKTPSKCNNFQQTSPTLGTNHAAHLELLFHHQGTQPHTELPNTEGSAKIKFNQSFGRLFSPASLWPFQRPQHNPTPPAGNARNSLLNRIPSIPCWLPRSCNKTKTVYVVYHTDRTIVHAVVSL